MKDLKKELAKTVVGGVVDEGRFARFKDFDEAREEDVEELCGIHVTRVGVYSVA